MRYAFSMEAIGDNFQAYFRDFDRQLLDPRRKEAPERLDQRLLRATKLGYTAPWVAQILGRDPRYRLARKFLRAEKDYSKSNGTGSRGIMLHYWLAPGVYEINQRISWKNHRRYFLRVHDDATATEMTVEEVREWLQQNAPSEQTS